MSEVQNIVIIGGSVAGHNLVNSLVPYLPTTHRILLIDANDFAYWPIAGLRAAVVPGWEDKIMAPITTPTFFKAGTPHQVIAPNKVVELKEGSVVLEKPFEGKTEVPFFKCILAIGSTQPSPMKPVGPTQQDAKQSLRQIQKDVEASKKILVIGGGPVGLEFAGEVRDRYPDKEITLVHNQPSLLNPSSNAPSNKAEGYTAPSSSPKLSVALEKEIKAINVNLILNDRAEPASGTEGVWDGTFGPQGGEKKVVLKSGKEVVADYVFVGVGNKMNVGIVEAADKGAISDGMVWVDEYLRVKSKTSPSPLANYYAIGDCCTTPGWKTSQGAQSDGQFAATNIINDIKGRAPKAYVRGVMHALLVPLGQEHGAGQITMPLLGTVSMPLMMIKAAKSKKLLVNEAFLTVYNKGEEKVPAVTF